MSAQELAKMLGLEAWTVVRWQKGLKTPPKLLNATLDLIAAKLKRKAERRCLYRYCEELLTGRKNKHYCNGMCRTREYLERKANETKP